MSHVKWVTWQIKYFSRIWKVRVRLVGVTLEWHQVTPVTLLIKGNGKLIQILFLFFLHLQGNFLNWPLCRFKKKLRKKLYHLEITQLDYWIWWKWHEQAGHYTYVKKKNLFAFSIQPAQISVNSFFSKWLFQAACLCHLLDYKWYETLKKCLRFWTSFWLGQPLKRRNLVNKILRDNSFGWFLGVQYKQWKRLLVSGYT